MAGDRAGALAHVNDETLLDRLAAGEKASHIAQQLGVHKSAIYHRFANRPEYLQARKDGTAVRIDDVEQEIETAADPFTLSRARERARIVLWRAEREFPGDWGAKQQITGDLQISVQINRGIDIEGEIVNQISDASETGS